MSALLLVLALTAAAPSEPAVAPPATTVLSPAVVAGASAAGFVGGGLFAVPAVLSILPAAGPFVAIPVGLAIAMTGAAFGGFVGELSYARLGGAGLVALVAGGGGLVGAAAGGAGAVALASSANVSTSDAVLFGFAGAAVAGVVGAAAGGAAGALWVPPEER